MAMVRPNEGAGGGEIEEDVSDDEQHEEQEEDPPSIKKARRGVMTLIDIDNISSSPATLESIAANQEELAKALNTIMTHLSSYSAASAGTDLDHSTYSDKFVKERTIFECKARFDGLITTDGVEALWSFDTKERNLFLEDKVFPKFNISYRSGRLTASDTKVTKVL